MATIVYPLLVFAIGVVVYALPTNPKVNELGRMTAFVGLFWLVGILSRTSVHF